MTDTYQIIDIISDFWYRLQYYSNNRDIKLCTSVSVPFCAEFIQTETPSQSLSESILLLKFIWITCRALKCLLFYLHWSISTFRSPGSVANRCTAPACCVESTYSTSNSTQGALHSHVLMCHFQNINNTSVQRGILHPPCLLLETM